MADAAGYALLPRKEPRSDAAQHQNSTARSRSRCRPAKDMLDSAMDRSEDDEEEEDITKTAGSTTQPAPQKVQRRTGAGPQIQKIKADSEEVERDMREPRCTDEICLRNPLPLWKARQTNHNELKSANR